MIIAVGKTKHLKNDVGDEFEQNSSKNRFKAMERS